MLARLAALDRQRDLVGNAGGIRDLEAGADGGDVANGAIHLAAVELDGSGLEYPLPWLRASLMHPIAIGLKFETQVNGGAKTPDHPVTFW
jgi:hypothetical protein